MERSAARRGKEGRAPERELFYRIKVATRLAAFHRPLLRYWSRQRVSLAQCWCNSSTENTLQPTVDYNHHGCTDFENSWEWEKCVSHCEDVRPYFSERMLNVPVPCFAVAPTVVRTRNKSEREREAGQKFLLRSARGNHFLQGENFPRNYSARRRSVVAERERERPSLPRLGRSF